MRTTLDIPDAVFKKAKLKAVEEGVALKIVVTRALEREVAAGGDGSAARKKRVERLFAALDKVINYLSLYHLGLQRITIFSPSNPPSRVSAGQCAAALTVPRASANARRASKCSRRF